MALIFWFMGYFGRKEATFAYLVHPLRVPESFFPQIENLSGVVFAIVLSHAGILPMPLIYPISSAGFSAECPWGPWALIFGPCGLILGLMLSPYLPRWTSDLCFIDAACIHQENMALKHRGIRGIGGFLLVSRQLRILWSHAYLSRLWCAPRRQFVCFFGLWYLGMGCTYKAEPFTSSPRADLAADVFLQNQWKPSAKQRTRLGKEGAQVNSLCIMSCTLYTCRMIYTRKNPLVASHCNEHPEFLGSSG